MRHSPRRLRSPSSETSFSKSNREPVLMQGHGRPEERLVQKVKRNHVAFLSDVDEQEEEHKLELVHVEQLWV